MRYFVRIIIIALMLITLFIQMSLSFTRFEQPKRFFMVSLPQISNKFYDGNEIRIPSSSLTEIQVFIPKPISDELDAGKIYVSLNGESANRLTDKRALPDGKLLTLDLKRIPDFFLRNGRNAIEVRAETNTGIELYDSCVLFAPYSIDGKEFKESEKFTGEKYAIVVGISKYQNIKGLNFADSDAKAFREFLISPQGGGVKPEKIQLLTNESATLANIIKALEEYKKKLKPEDLLVFFMAGHGAPQNADPNNPKPPFYYLTTDTRQDSIAKTALQMELLRDKLINESNVKRLISFIDTCHSAGFGGQGIGGLGMRRLSLNDLSNQYSETSLFNPEGMAVITSSDINETSYEDLLNDKQRWQGHGVFTFYLLEGLKGQADFNKDKIVTAGELFRYIEDQVPKAVDIFIEDLVKKGISRSDLSSQHPRAAIANNENLPLSFVSEEKPLFTNSNNKTKKQ